ncbi:unnamed protein product [Allacma fusca]|uniref:Tetraspanin n=1 Tax=Allacma fusca TaxID=39272 RepID=A0A8J2P4G3_9HEXA|nr:unnamed protein product [Allacma fusca]
MKIRIREVFLKKTLKIFAAVNCILLIWAITVMVYTLISDRKQDRSVQFIRQEVGFDRTGLISIIISSCLLIVVSLIGIIGAFFHSPLLFNSYRSFLTGALCLKVFALLWSSVLHPNPIFPKYLKFFEVETLYFQNPDNHSDMWKNRLMLWNDIQTQLKCCGVHDFQDWIHSVCKCVPMSCCRRSKIETCKTVLTGPVNAITAEDLKNIKNVIHPIDCMTAFRRLMNELQTFLLIFAITILFVELILYSFCSHLLKLIEHHVKIVRREGSDFDGKFGIWLLEPSDTILGGIPALERENSELDRPKKHSHPEKEQNAEDAKADMEQHSVFPQEKAGTEFNKGGENNYSIANKHNVRKIRSAE